MPQPGPASPLFRIGHKPYILSFRWCLWDFPHGPGVVFFEPPEPITVLFPPLSAPRLSLPRSVGIDRVFVGVGGGLLLLVPGKPLDFWSFSWARLVVCIPFHEFVVPKLAFRSTFSRFFRANFDRTPLALPST